MDPGKLSKLKCICVHFVSYFATYILEEIDTLLKGYWMLVDQNTGLDKKHRRKNHRFLPVFVILENSKCPLTCISLVNNKNKQKFPFLWITIHFPSSPFSWITYCSTFLKYSWHFYISCLILIQKCILSVTFLYTSLWLSLLNKSA